MGYKPDLSDLGAPNSVNRVRHLRLGVGEKITAPDGNESRILIWDTWNTDIVPELEPQAGDDIVYKTRFSGFFETDLDAGDGVTFPKMSTVARLDPSVG